MQAQQGPGHWHPGGVVSYGVDAVHGVSKAKGLPRRVRARRRGVGTSILVWSLVLTNGEGAAHGVSIVQRGKVVMERALRVG